MDKGVLAIFVKTPEFSPVKTRLAAAIGKKAAIQFYDLSLRAVEAIIFEVRRQMPEVDVVWAVAESEALGMDRWNTFKNVSQGSGGLGERLSYVYDQLKAQYQYVSFIGADSPHILPKDLIQALSFTKLGIAKKEFVIGETDDGGFYFFGGSQNIGREVWLNVEYSSDKTASQLKDRLSAYGSTKKIPTTFDVDVVEDLRRLSDQMVELPEQKALIKWARSVG